MYIWGCLEEENLRWKEKKNWGRIRVLYIIWVYLLCCFVVCEFNIIDLKFYMVVNL